MKKKFSILVLVCALVVAFSAVGVFADTTAATQKPGTAKDGNELSIETAAMNLVTQTKSGKYKLVKTATLHSWVTKKSKMVLIDTMPASSYKSGHISGAVNAEVGMSSKEFTSAQKKALLKAAGKNKKAKIVVYCGFVKCPRSHYAAAYLVQKGYKNVYRQPGGLVAWQDAGYTLVK
ncbi:MAG: rhodanese-like domain-containing protein [Eubacterium sp.]